jgi:hypothetical protein
MSLIQLDVTDNGFGKKCTGITDGILTRLHKKSHFSKHY